MYAFLDIIGWLWHGMLQLIRVVVPVIQPAAEPWSPPGWFTDVWPDWLWWYYLDSDSRPTETWCHNYIYAARVQMQRWIERRSDQARDTALEWVRAFTGWVAHGYSTFQDWLEAIRERTGTWVPWWSDSLADAASVLWLKLPDAIRYAWQTWDDIWEGIKSSVRAGGSRCGGGSMRLWRIPTAPLSPGWARRGTACGPSLRIVWTSGTTCGDRTARTSAACSPIRSTGSMIALRIY